MSIKNTLIYHYRSHFVRKSWKKRFALVRKAIDNFSLPNKEKVKLHKDYWEAFSRNFYPDTLLTVNNTAFDYDVAIIPEEIYAIDIEPSLNKNTQTFFLENKSVLDYWFKSDYLPIAVIHRMDGVYYDPSFQRISNQDLSTLIKQIKLPVLFKPNQNSFGGKGVQIINKQYDLKSLVLQKDNFIIQEIAKQHPFFCTFNSHGLNTIRVCCYRSVISNEWHFLNASLRMGVGGSLDNVTAGGIVAYINESGFLNGIARDKYGVCFTSHPDTAKLFDEKIPLYDELRMTSIQIANKIFYARVISLDMYLDHNNQWRSLEVNLKGQTIRFAQYAGVPFFGRFTEEVKDYCLKNHWKDQ